jgi:hypothetical protein
VAFVSYGNFLPEVKHVGQNAYNIILSIGQVEYNDLKYLDSFPLSEDRFIRVVRIKNSCAGLQIHVVIVGREW